MLDVAAFVLNRAMPPHGKLVLFEVSANSSSVNACIDIHAKDWVPNTLNVISNFPFLVIGVVGLILCLHGNYFGLSLRGEVWGWAFFYIGITATAFGSAYYHLKPDDARLVWDRLPLHYWLVHHSSAPITSFSSTVAASLGEIYLLTNSKQANLKVSPRCRQSMVPVPVTGCHSLQASSNCAVTTSVKILLKEYLDDKFTFQAARVILTPIGATCLWEDYFSHWWHKLSLGEYGFLYMQLVPSLDAKFIGLSNNARNIMWHELCRIWGTMEPLKDLRFNILFPIEFPEHIALFTKDVTLSPLSNKDIRFSMYFQSSIFVCSLMISLELGTGKELGMLYVFVSWPSPCDRVAIKEQFVEIPRIS
eukprot:Gb_33669 [translate_table: standard]